LINAVRVLIVDDHPVIRHGLAVALRQESSVLRVEEAGNADEALALLKHRVIDIAVVDILMPKTSGVRLASQLHDLQPECRVLAFSVINEPGLIADMFRAHACGFVLKTQPIADIVRAMYDVLAGKNYLPPGVSREAIEAALGGDGANPLRRLTAREYEVFELLIRGYTTTDVAAKLFISPRTVEQHRQRIANKLSANSLRTMQLLAVRHGVLET
jgi:DNA-binding NarL/FixJ family response regulator